MAIPRSYEDRQRDNLVEHPSVANLVAKVVFDPDTQSIIDALQAILAALGGSVSTSVQYETSAPTTAGVEVALTIPAGTKEFRFQSLGDFQLKWSFVSGGTATDEHFIAYAGCQEKVAQLFGTTKTVYVASPVDGDTIRAIYFLNS